MDINNNLMNHTLIQVLIHKYHNIILFEIPTTEWEFLCEYTLIILNSNYFFMAIF